MEKAWKYPVVVMEGKTLRELQAPLKEQYKRDPESALVLLKAECILGDDLTATVNTPVGTVTAGLHSATGGSGTFACSGDMLLQALAACAGVTMNAVATALEITLIKAVIKVEGEVDFRGTLGVSKETPVGFKNINLDFIIDSDAPADKIATLVSLTERYCVVLQTIKNTPEITNKITRIER